MAGRVVVNVRCTPKPIAREQNALNDRRLPAAGFEQESDLGAAMGGQSQSWTVCVRHPSGVSTGRL